jgi:hypothetical protein
VFADYRTAPVSEPCRAALAFITTLTLSPDDLGPQDVRDAREAGVSRQALLDAIYISVFFNMIDRVADSTGFDNLDDEGHMKGAKYLLKYGYRFPPPLRWLARSPTW